MSKSLVLAAALCASLVPVPALAQGKVDLDVINRIRAEGFERSQVMETLRYLTDEIGPRLTGSPAMKRANEWTRDTMAKWGMKNAHLEGFEFGRGWSFTRSAVHMIRPHEVPLSALPKAWTPGTSGPVRGEAMAVDIEEAADLDRFRGKVRGKILFMDEARIDDPPEQMFERYSGDQLRGIGKFDIPDDHVHDWRRGYRKALELRPKLNAFLAEEKPVAMVYISSRQGNLVRVMGYTFKPGDAPPVPQLVMSTEHYNRIMRLMDAGKTVELEIDVRAQFHDDDSKAYNTIAEIPGTNRRNEIVMAGAHLDSWHGGTGAVDNGAGCAAIMEAARILLALGLRPSRTIRIALWSGEEQGLHGSRAYVSQHFASRPEPTDPEQRALPESLREPQWPIRRKPEHARLSAYFNLDNGSGKIRGVWAEGNAAVKPIFEAWLRPFADLDANTVTLRGTFGTDHLSFQAVGLPGFQFIQDPLDYRARLHHTNIDVFDHIQPKDMMQASVIIAAFLYHAAMMPERMPREPMPRAPTAAEKAERDKAKEKAKKARERRLRREK